MLLFSHTPYFIKTKSFSSSSLEFSPWSGLQSWGGSPLNKNGMGHKHLPRQLTPNGPHWTVLHLLHNSVLLFFLLVTLSQNPQLNIFILVLTSLVLVWFIYQLLPLSYFLASRRRDIFMVCISAGIALTLSSSCKWDRDLLLSISTIVGKLRIHFHLCFSFFFFFLM